MPLKQEDQKKVIQNFGMGKIIHCDREIFPHFHNNISLPITFLKIDTQNIKIYEASNSQSLLLKPTNCPGIIFHFK